MHGDFLYAFFHWNRDPVVSHFFVIFLVFSSGRVFHPFCVFFPFTYDPISVSYFKKGANVCRSLSMGKDLS